ncbi:glycerate kinase [Bacillus sp. DX1.1]|uniref:glycerate kinase n=1 Tax=unclassified Bacillus (in: firmicutes) TaxID=185979 RepID=UPI00256FF6A2|nr:MULTISPECIES: glycerate kinase [unclassified Bacillus (in: firmicutes)]MDM5153752.1 glycerate kinase [Bacillus sp. DX1.1]WJE82689.1 glycerate kinase [Bacillus sp. DX3.1]
MKVLIAIDSFKGSISSADGSKAISLGIKDVYPNAKIVTLPLADGGEGTVEALVQATGGQFIKKEVTGPLNKKVDAVYGILGDGNSAVIEVAAACGLPLVPSDKRNPSVTTTYGVGELIFDAIEKGCREFIVGLGGSATNDAGIGMLQALGFRFLDQHNEEVGLGGKELRNIHKIDVTHAHPVLKDCTFKIACDVNNPLYGPTGAAYVFAPQKGATAEMVEELDKEIENFAQVALQELNMDIHNIAGAGAAGGLGYAFAGFLHARLQSGIQLVLDLIGMEEKMQGVDFVITGEGKLDGQTSMGKAPLGVAQLAQKYHIPVIALAGGVTEETSILNELGITSYFSIVNEPMSLEKAMDSKVTFNNLRVTTNQLFQLIQAIQPKR